MEAVFSDLFTKLPSRAFNLPLLSGDLTLTESEEQVSQLEKLRERLSPTNVFPE